MELVELVVPSATVRRGRNPEPDGPGEPVWSGQGVSPQVASTRPVRVGDCLLLAGACGMRVEEGTDVGDFGGVDAVRQAGVHVAFQSGVSW